jgi:DeoR/GlpR family transcriptional regulator of sugar metabolism
MMTVMLSTQRKKLILERLNRDGQIVAKTLSRELQLSEDTIRRDLRELAHEGLLQRVHGGALPASPAIADFATRQHQAPAAKLEIGRAAARLVTTGSVVIVDGGTTAVQLVRHLPENLSATIVTHSATIAVELVRHPKLEVIMIGGRLFKHSVVNVGAAAIEAIARVRADLYFMGVTGVHAEQGLSTGDMEESYVKRALIASAAETIVLASSEKLNAASPYIIAPLSEISSVITERDTPLEKTAPLEAKGVTVTRAS